MLAQRLSNTLISNTRIWSAVGFAAVVSARAAAEHLPLCPAFHALIWQQQRETVRVGEVATVRHLRVVMSLCVACACACAHVYVTYTHSLQVSHIRFFVRLSSRDILTVGRPVFCVLPVCAPGSPWNSRRRSCIERTRVASAAPWSMYRTAWHCCRSLRTSKLFFLKKNQLH